VFSVTAEVPVEQVLFHTAPAAFYPSHSNLAAGVTMAKIAVNGVGTIGKRVAEAVQQQDDMDLIGVADVQPSGELRTVLNRGQLQGTPLYAGTDDAISELGQAGFDVEETVDYLAQEADLVIDCTPSGVDQQNKENLYEPHDTKAIFQGGADASIAPVAFNATANYDEAQGEDFVKVVSCNTTPLCRTLDAVDTALGVDQAIVNLVRRGGDPKQDGRGPINSIKPVTHVPSHHGPDVQAVMPDIDIQTLAVKVPTTLAHVHMAHVELDGATTDDEVVDLFRQQPRIRLEHAHEGYESTAKVIEKMRDLHQPRYDMHEAAVWADTITVDDSTLYWMHMVQQESIVVPDNIDAIRSMLGLAEARESRRKTNNSLGIE